MGGASIAGEERNGTMKVLLANPKSRTNVLISKAGALVALAGLAVVSLWVPVHPVAALLGVEIGGLEVEALALHLFVNGVFYGSMAMAIGAVTGSRNTATGATTGILVLSFFAVGPLPLVEGLEELRKLSPLYYFNGRDPLRNGIAWRHLSVLLSISALFFAAAVAGFNRRDLKSQSVGTTLLDRIRANPHPNRLIGRLASSARVSSIWAKTVSDYQALLLITSVTTFLAIGVLLGPTYASLSPEARNAYANLPDELLALFGGRDMSTPEGWYTIETFGLMAPLSVILVTAVMGAGALAGEESRRTMGLLLANPLNRSRIVIEKTAIIVLFGMVVGIASFAGVALESVCWRFRDVHKQDSRHICAPGSGGPGVWRPRAGPGRRHGTHFGRSLWGCGGDARLPPVDLAVDNQRCPCGNCMVVAIPFLPGQRPAQHRQSNSSHVPAIHPGSSHSCIESSSLDSCQLAIHTSPFSVEHSTVTLRSSPIGLGHIVATRSYRVPAC